MFRLRSIWMSNLISHYLILSSPGRSSVQSCSLNPRHRFSSEKWCVAAQLSTDFPLFVSRHTLFPHFPCVACTVNFLSLRTISIYLLKLFWCQSFVLSIIVQNIQLPKYTWFNSTNRWNQFFNWMLYLFTLLYRGMMHQIPSQWAHECALYCIGRHITCLSVDNKERLSVPIFILQYWKQFYCAHRLGDVYSCSPLHWICKV